MSSARSSSLELTACSLQSSLPVLLLQNPLHEHPELRPHARTVQSIVSCRHPMRVIALADNARSASFSPSAGIKTRCPLKTAAAFASSRHYATAKLTENAEISR